MTSQRLNMCGTLLGKTPHGILRAGKCVTGYSVASQRLNMCGTFLPKTQPHDFQRAEELEAGHSMIFPAL